MIPEKKSFFLSLNIKILLLIMGTFLLASGVSVFVFISISVKQLETESLYNKNKAEILWEMYQENRVLRDLFGRLYEKKETFDQMMENNGARLDALLTKDRFFGLRYNLFSDKQNLKARQQKMQVISLLIVLSVLLFMLMLIFLWLCMRRWIMEPLEHLLEGTEKLSQGQWAYRLPETGQAATDELHLLEKNFNVMAGFLQNKVFELKENEQFLQNLLDAIPDGVRVIDDSFGVVRVNRSYAERYPLSDGTLLASKCYQARCRRSSPCAADNCPLIRLQKGDIASMKIIQPFFNAQNQETFAEVVAAPLEFEKDGKTIRYTVEIVRSLEQEIMFSHQQKLSSLGVLSGAIAHEMRNPLGSMRLILENILDRMQTKPFSEAEMTKYLTLIYNQMTACIEVTNRLLKLARKPTAEKERVNLNEIVSETASLMEYEAKKEGLTIVLNTAPDAAEILATDAEMRIVTLNLLQNAFRATKSGGTVTLTVCRCDDRVTVDCKDTGSGISPEDVPHIFEPFFSQGKDNGRDKDKGTGLGLAIVKNIVENHGGTVAVESVLGDGTDFSVSFPAYRETDG